MKLYLVQHGESEAESVNPARPLTDRGRREARRVAAVAARLRLSVYQIRHSGKTRAEQTATIFGEALLPPGGVVATSGLNPNDEVRPLADALKHEPQPVMLVGHLPFLARLCGMLVAGEPERAIVQFRYGALVSLSREQDHWLVESVITPEIASGIAETE